LSKGRGATKMQLEDTSRMGSLDFQIVNSSTPWNEVLFEKLTVAKLVKKKSPPFVEHEGLLLYS